MASWSNAAAAHAGANSATRCASLETCPGCRITLEVPAAIARAGDLARLERYEQSCTFLTDVVMHLPACDAALDEVRTHACLARGEPDLTRARFAVAAAGFAGAGRPLDA